MDMRVTGADADLYRMYSLDLMRIGFCLTGSRETAEDLVQDTFLRCSGRLASVDNPGAYLRAALVNACRSHNRRRVLSARLRRPQPSAIQVPHELVELRDVLLRLPLRQRTVIVLRYVADLDDEQISGMLGCPRSTVRSLARRALGRLREELS